MDSHSSIGFPYSSHDESDNVWLVIDRESTEERIGWRIVVRNDLSHMHAEARSYGSHTCSVLRMILDLPVTPESRSYLATFVKFVTKRPDWVSILIEHGLGHLLEA